MENDEREIKMLKAELRSARKRAESLGYELRSIEGHHQYHWDLSEIDQVPCTGTGREVYHSIGCHDLTVVHNELDKIYREKEKVHDRNH